MDSILFHPDEKLLTYCKQSQDRGVLNATANTLLDAMRDVAHCVGLAANQLGYLERVCVVDASKVKRRGSKVSENMGEFVLINPKIISTAGNQTVREGCMSVPQFTVNVERHCELVLEADNYEKPLRFVGFEAVVVQHELDHLDGFTILERAKSANDVYPRKVYRA